MRLTVRDNGLGFGEHADSAGTGVGLANLRERLAVHEELVHVTVEINRRAA